MAYKYIDSEKLEKRRRRSTKTSGIFAIIIGALCFALGLFFLVALKSVGGMIVALIFALVFIVAGVYFFNQIKIEEKRLRELDDPNSKAYKKRQQNNQKKRAKYLKKADHHGTLKSILCRRAALIWGSTTIFMWLLSLVLLAMGIIIFILPVFDVLCPIAFVASLFGKTYKAVLAEYQKCGLDKKEAEEDFATSKAYIISTEVIAVSSRFLTYSSIPLVLSVDDIVWAYSGYDNIHKYSNGGYSHTERNYCVIVALTNGMQYKIFCPEELCTVIISDITNAGNLITVGYSKELNNLYNASSENFRGALKNTEKVHTKPIGPDIYNSDHSWD